ncbi:MAG: 4-hydroxybenzoate octaprenyltransferase [Aeromonadaceae bacterium]
MCHRSLSLLAKPSPWVAYWQLARLDRPIGSLLLLWPTLWSLWLASSGLPSPWLLLVFTLGVFLMRSAGCVINDYADRHVDGFVRRTAQRPLPAGRLSTKQALRFLLLLLVLALSLVLTLNPFTILLSLVGLGLALIYPFMKRVTHLPQLVLGLAFSWSIPMAWAAATDTLTASCGWLFLANCCWTIAYDTYYAMVDREDDLQIGVKSTAILFGRHDRLIIGLLQSAMLAILSWVGVVQALAWPYYLGLLGAAGLFCYQQWLVRGREREACFQAFLHNNWVGMVIFLGMAAALALPG